MYGLDCFWIKYRSDQSFLAIYYYTSKNNRNERRTYLRRTYEKSQQRKIDSKDNAFLFKYLSFTSYAKKIHNRQSSWRSHLDMNFFSKLRFTRLRLKSPHSFAWEYLDGITSRHINHERINRSNCDSDNYWCNRENALHRINVLLLPFRMLLHFFISL